MSELEKFESKCGVVLPEGYRRFLLEIGTGSFLLNLGEVSSSETYYLSEVEKRRREQRAQQQLMRLHRPFPFWKVWIWELEEWDEDELKKAQGEFFDGSLQITDTTCAGAEYLIVTGPERGNVWQFCDVGIRPAEPSKDFLTWYEDVLDGISS